LLGLLCTSLLPQTSLATKISRRAPVKNERITPSQRVRRKAKKTCKSWFYYYDDDWTTALREECEEKWSTVSPSPSSAPSESICKSSQSIDYLTWLMFIGLCGFCIWYQLLVSLTLYSNIIHHNSSFIESIQDSITESYWNTNCM